MNEENRENNRGQPGFANTPKHPQDRQPTFDLSEEEQNILRRCSRESLKAGVPYGIFGGATVWALVQRGILNPNPSYGAFPKVLGAAVISFFIGRVSYFKSDCYDLILNELPNSSLANNIRRVRGLPAQGYLDDQASQHSDPGMAETFAPPEGESEAQAKASGTTYDALRKQHREKYSQHGFQQPRQPAAIQPQAAPQPDPEVKEADPMYAPPSKLRRRPTNKYGDEGFE